MLLSFITPVTCSLFQFPEAGEGDLDTTNISFAELAELAVVLVGCFPVTQQACSNMDTTACHSMSRQIPNLCSDITLGKIACPQFCNLCRLECYQCSYVFDDHHLCNTTKTCGQGEVCMKKVVTSVEDGHREYELTCEPKTRCDGRDLTLPFGKRSIGARDISVSCCYHDLCNSPFSVTPTDTPTDTPTTSPIAGTTASPGKGTTQACKKDVTVVIENSQKSYREVNVSDIKNFLLGVISGLDIGPNAVLMSVAKFAEDASTVWKLDTHTDNRSLANAVQDLHLLRDHDGSEMNTAMAYILQSEHTSGHRPDADDVIIIITDDLDHGIATTYLAQELNRHFDDVIVMTIDSDRDSDHDDVHVATDTHHEFQMRNSHGLIAKVPKVINLICS